MNEYAHRRKMFILAYLAYGAIYIARLNLTVATPVLQENGILSATQIGMMSGAFFLFYSLGQLINGWLGDILPPVRMVSTGLFLTAGTNLFLGIILNAETAVIFWAVNGFAQSMLWGPLLRSIGSQYPQERKPFIASLLVSSVGVGSVLGILLATAAIQLKNVQYAFLIPGMFALLSAVAVILFFCPGTEAATVGNRESSKKNAAVHSAFFSIINSRMLLLLVPALFHGILKDGINLWAAAYFMDTFGVDLVAMSFYVFAVPLLSLIGRLIYPVFYRFFRQQEHIVSVFALGICVVCLIPLCLPWIPVGAAAIFLGITAAAISVVNTSFLTIYPMRHQAEGCVSKVVGVMDFATYAGAGIGSLVYGIWLEQHSYTGVFLSWIILAVLAVGILMFWQKKQRMNAAWFR